MSSDVLTWCVPGLGRGRLMYARWGGGTEANWEASPSSGSSGRLVLAIVRGGGGIVGVVSTPPTSGV